MKVPADVTFMLSINMLAGFAVELYLKAVLAHYGVTETALKHSSRRHSLKTLHDEVEGHGLHCSALKQLSAHFHARHQDYSYRYVDRQGDYELMHLTQMFAIFSDGDGCVDGLLGASASVNVRLPRQLGWIVPPAEGAWRLPA